MKTKIILFGFIILTLKFSGQNYQESIQLLGIDTNYRCIQFSTNHAAALFKKNMEKSKHGGRTVIYHYGASHIQGEIVTGIASHYLHEKFGSAGPGFFFPFSAANTYNSINSKTSHTGEWTYAKSFQLPPKIPLGLRGMTVSTTDTSASFTITMNAALPEELYRLQCFLDINQMTPEFDLLINQKIVKHVSKDTIQSHFGEAFLEVVFEDEIKSVSVQRNGSSEIEEILTCYGINIEHKVKQGILYEAFGVGASQFQSVLSLEKLEDQAPHLLPDVVIIDFGTNNILYTNTMDENIPRYVHEIVTKFKAINPEVSIVFTSMQDLYRKGKYIDAGIRFNEVVDSMAQVTNSLYWNFYDLSGGYKKIRFWHEKGFAQSDYIHLTKKGYEIKGRLLFESIETTLNALDANNDLTELRLPVKKYTELLKAPDPVLPKQEQTETGSKKYYTVKKGDTLSGIAQKNKTTVSKIKKLNQLKTDKIQIGQKLRVK
ncbi:MAG: LysM peptidoglycan-binding domain-containing protein [Bacteroidetes bacterium]|nr:LysM peptidoglycan-binding domain-containing protein [Bacteroidota bacterium]